jgi:uncharacterized protein (DUF362 family)/Pyruvate/2-oxoacid:ferredoxin oxidoreductase delta subunit
VFIIELQKMKTAKVSIVRIEDYSPERIREGLNKSLDLIGGLENLIPSKIKVFIKINHLSPPEKAIITHPVFTQEVIRLLQALDCQITVGDDIQSRDKDGFAVSGYRQVCEDMGVRLINLKEKGFREVECRGQLLEKTFISTEVLDADIIVNLPKLKTHSFTVYTGAVKNMYGIIPHGLRLHYHRRFQKNETFSQMLVDILSCARPHLTLMDGITAMEGEGPSAGNPKHVGIVLSSQDAVAADTVGAELAGIPPEEVFSTQNAHERSLGIGKKENIEILGETIPSAKSKDFKHSALAVGFLRRKIPAFLYAYFQGQLIFTPEVNVQNCTQCMECIEVCPAKAVRQQGDQVQIQKHLCIHCMCCHEVCRFYAIRLKQRPIGKAIRKVASFLKKAKYLIS